MFTRILTISLFVISTYQAWSQPINNFKISEEQFKSTYKFDSVAHYDKSTIYLINDTICGISDQWAYVFEDQEIQRVYFNHYTNEIIEQNFTRNLFAAKNIIEDFTNYYNEPDDMIIGDTLFVDPYDKRHYGYDVIEARWNDYDGMKIKVEFHFFGGKGEYHFILSVNFFDIDYPYFD